MSEEKPRYLSAQQLAEITGYSKRFFQDLAASGKCTWARQPAGERGRIFFDVTGFEAWWQSAPKARPKKERQSWRRSTGVTVSRGARSKGAAAPSADPLIQKTRQLRNSALMRGSRSSTPTATELASETTQSEKLLTGS
jgi:hypothetical protein